MNIERYDDVMPFLEQYMPHTLSTKFLGTTGFERSEYFLSLLGNPQDSVKSIHIAGTSGKGSTATLISQLLHAHGFKTGLTLSPHIIDIRERVQINNEPISQELFLHNLNAIMPAIEHMENSEYEKPSYFEILIALAFYTFAQERVDYAVIETGIGGLLDSTNTIQREDKVCVITSIGFDHMDILGHALPEIAAQKAGIIHEHQPVITIQQDHTILDIVTKQAEKMHSPLIIVPKPTHIHTSGQGTIFDFSLNNIHLDSLHTGLIGTYQADNASLAISCLYTLSKRDSFAIDVENIRKALLATTLPARFAMLHFGPTTLIIDGAHNGQKMHGFVSSLKNLYPNLTFPILISIKNTKQCADILNQLLPITSTLVITHTETKQDTPIHSHESLFVYNKAQSLGFEQIVIKEDPKEALEYAMQQAPSHHRNRFFVFRLYSLCSFTGLCSSN